jgi:hypothetical protein
MTSGNGLPYEGSGSDAQKIRSGFCTKISLLSNYPNAVKKLFSTDGRITVDAREKD